MSKPSPLNKSDFNYFDNISTRWSDNDIYGHVNNVMYYAFFDTAVNRFLITHADLDIHDGDTIGLVVHSSCDYFAPVSYPQALQAGVRVLKIGNSSVTYQVAIFLDDSNKADKTKAVAQGVFTHVYVDKQNRKSQPLSDAMKEVLKTLLVNSAEA